MSFTLIKDYQKKLARQIGNDQIEGLIGAGHNVLLYGRKGTGKSLFACFLARAKARGENFLKFKVKDRGKILIIDEETPDSDFEIRRKAIFGDENLQIATWPRPESRGFTFGNSEWVKKLKSVVKDYAPDILIIDNLNAIQGKLRIEESNVAVGELRQIFASLKEGNNDLAIILIHHEGKDETRGARGVSAIEDMSDTVIQLKRVWDNPFQFAVELIPRKRPVSCKPFLVELKTDGEKWELEEIGEVEEVTLPDRNDLLIAEHFIVEKGVKTVNQLHQDCEGEIGIVSIRNAVTKLWECKFLKRQVGPSNLHKFSLNPDFPDTPFIRALKGELKKRGVCVFYNSYQTNKTNQFDENDKINEIDKNFKKKTPPYSTQKDVFIPWEEE